MPIKLDDMKMLLVSFTTAILTIACNLQPKENSKIMLKAFINDIMDKNVSVERIAETYLCALPSNEKNKQFVTFQLNGLRSVFQSQLQNTISIVKYNDLPLNERQLFIDNNSLKNVFIIKQKNLANIFVLIEHERISSFVTINKGGKKVFLKFC